MNYNRGGGDERITNRTKRGKARLIVLPVSLSGLSFHVNIICEHPQVNLVGIII